MGLAKASKYKFLCPLAIILHIKTKYQYMNHEIYLSFPLLQNKPFLNQNQILVHFVKREHKKKIEYAFAKGIMVLQSFSQQKNKGL